jgi:hypothetical protein
MTCTACLVCLISTASDRRKNTLGKPAPYETWAIYFSYISMRMPHVLLMFSSVSGCRKNLGSWSKHIIQTVPPALFVHTSGALVLFKSKFYKLSCLEQSTLNYSIFPTKNFKRLNETSNCYSLSIRDELAIVSCICIYGRISSFPADVFPATQLRHHRHSAEVQVEGRTTLPRQAESCRCPGYEASRNKGRTWNIERTSRQGVDIVGLTYNGR